eukprot:CAMPEP_0170482956 /NCGR_PEP_ID=MMETSP0208-20121228/2743_1 /TAXON_ID=197538 /ORGANISM="Strombidium inclinatum, Strain S3" /LENGTH=76 /DNA_ID=CAMNT_0010755847 /DNA_START=659 /DNA_END=889 /DNA_ORIENTATION=+
MDSHYEGVIIFDQTQQIVYANPKIRDLCDLQQSDSFMQEKQLASSDGVLGWFSHGMRLFNNDLSSQIEDDNSRVNV